jgi:molybdopterin/thiamine biosynthesis adenylyltransferase
MTAIVFADGELSRLRTRLLADSPNEAAAVLVASRVDGSSRRLLVRETHVPGREFVDVGPTHATIAPAYFMPLLKRASRDGSSLIFVHTHPFSAQPHFSSIDDAGEVELRRVSSIRAPDRPHGALVLGTEGFEGRIWSTGGTANVDELRQVGPEVAIHRRSDPVVSLQDDVDRTVRAIGEAGQRALRAVRVAIVGLGGIGSHVAQQLAHLAVGRLVLVDDDRLERSNLNRVIGGHATAVGELKVAVAARMTRATRQDIEVVEVAASALDISIAKRLRDVDAIFCCTDTHGSRAVLNQLAYQYYVPVFDVGVRIDVRDSAVTSVRGRVQMVGPGLGCLVCSELLDSIQVRTDLMSEEERARDQYVVGHRESQPAVVSLNGTLASMAVTMFLGAMVGFPIQSRYQLYRADSGVVRSVRAPQNPNCVVCSATSFLGRGDLIAMLGKSGT